MTESDLAQAAWLVLSLYKMRGKNWERYLLAKGWTRSKKHKGKLNCPYSDDVFVWDKAKHVERERSRTRLLECMTEIGWPVEMTSMALPDETIARLAAVGVEKKDGRSRKAMR